MVIQCIKVRIDSIYHDVINNNLNNYIIEGAKYMVYGIRVTQGTIYFMIFLENHLVDVPSDMFSIIDGKLSPLWIIKNNEEGEMTIWPEIFYEEDFFEKFSDWEKEERQKFDELRKFFAHYDV